MTHCPAVLPSQRTTTGRSDEDIGTVTKLAAVAWHMTALDDEISPADVPTQSWNGESS